MTLPRLCPWCGPQGSLARRTLWEVGSMSLMAGEDAQALELGDASKALWEWGTEQAEKVAFPARVSWGLGGRGC